MRAKRDYKRALRETQHFRAGRPSNRGHLVGIFAGWLRSKCGGSSMDRDDRADSEEGVMFGGGTPQSNGIPMRPFGRHDQQISALGFGGHHLGDAPNEQTAIRIVQE